MKFKHQGKEYDMPVKKLSLKEINARPLGNGLITDEERNSPSYKKWMKGRSVSKALDKKKKAGMSKETMRSLENKDFGAFTKSFLK